MIIMSAIGMRVDRRRVRIVRAPAVPAPADMMAMNASGPVVVATAEAAAVEVTTDHTLVVIIRTNDRIRFGHRMRTIQRLRIDHRWFMAHRSGSHRDANHHRRHATTTFPIGMIVVRRRHHRVTTTMNDRHRTGCSVSLIATIMYGQSSDHDRLCMT